MPAHAFGAAVPVVALVVVHLLATRFRAAVGGKEAGVVSAAGGISVAYVFLHLLPEVAAGAGVLGESLEGLIAHVPLQEIAVFVVALLGFTVFYVAERFAARSGSPRHGAQGTEATGPAFAVHVGAFAVYNIAVAYTLPERVASDLVEAAVFTVAVAVHILVADRGLAEHYPRRYRAIGRYVLSAALVVGWLAAGVAAPTSSLTVSLMTAVVAGTVLLTVFQEELPRARASRIGWFLGGLAAYSALLIALAALDPGAGEG